MLASAGGSRRLDWKNSWADLSLSSLATRLLAARHFARAILANGEGWTRPPDLTGRGPAGREAVAVDFAASRPASAHEIGASAYSTASTPSCSTMPPGSLEQVVFRMDVLHQLQVRGVQVTTCLLRSLKSASISIWRPPGSRTPACRSRQRSFVKRDEAQEAFAALGGDVVVKPLFGSEGRGMVCAFPTQKPRGARSYPDDRNTVVPSRVRSTSRLGSANCLALGGGVGGHAAPGPRRLADERRAVQGGKAEAVVPGAVEVELALRASAVLGTVVAGVDLLPRPAGGWYVLEVNNAVPGWRWLAPSPGWMWRRRCGRR